MRVLITSGGTREYIDDVRILEKGDPSILTNISSGALGSIVADEFVGDGGLDKPRHEVYYLHSKTSVRPVRFIDCINIEKNSVKEVYAAMEEVVPKVDLVIHAMAISDFYFDRDNPVKIKGNDVEAFAEHIRQNARVSPKIISYVKQWNPSVSLVGFKFTVGKSVEDLVDIARISAVKSGCDIVVANDKIQMQKAQEHVAYFVRPDGSYEPFHGKEQIAKGLLRAAESVLV